MNQIITGNSGDATNSSLQYQLILPERYEAKPEQRWPLVLFLHGAGERGEDFSKIYRHNPMRRILQGWNLEAIMLVPLCPELPPELWWDARLPLVNQLLDRIQAQYRVDPDRISVTGFSMGAFGTMAVVGRDPSHFAAAAPICGGADFRQAYRVGKAKLPIWIFHGDADPIIPLGEAHHIVDVLKHAGHDQFKLTIYPGVDHDSWNQTYAQDEFWQWLLSQHRRGK